MAISKLIPGASCNISSLEREAEKAEENDKRSTRRIKASQRLYVQIDNLNQVYFIM